MVCFTKNFDHITAADMADAHVGLSDNDYVKDKMAVPRRSQQAAGD